MTDSTPQGKTSTPDKPVVEEGKPQEPVPSSDKPTEGEKPEDTSPRTAEQFDKLTQSNKTLKEENDALKAKAEKTTTPNVLDSLKPQVQPQPVTQTPQPQPVKPVVVPQGQTQDGKLISDDGTQVDPYLLEKSLKDSKLAAEEAKKQAIQAREEARRYAETQQVRDAHAKFPQLNPKSPDYDAKFYAAVKNEVVGQMTKGFQDLVAAADTVSKWYELAPTKKEQEETQAGKTQTQKEQINATPPAKPIAKTDHSDLIKRQQKGDRAATAERLARSGF